MSKSKKITIAAITLGSGLIVGGVIGTVSGVAFAENTKQEKYTVNDRGQSYGSSLHADTYEDEPDLIAAEATNGKSGYVFKDDIEGDIPKNPEEASAMSRQHREDRTIKVYESDGTTVIGEFVVEAGDVVVDGRPQE